MNISSFKNKRDNKILTRKINGLYKILDVIWIYNMDFGALIKYAFIDFFKYLEFV